MLLVNEYYMRHFLGSLIPPSALFFCEQQLKKEVWEWLHETIHPDYFQKIWNMGGRKTPPVSILCF